MTDPVQRIKDDPLYILRVMKLLLNGFEIDDPKLRKALRNIKCSDLKLDVHFYKKTLALTLKKSSLALLLNEYNLLTSLFKITYDTTQTEEINTQKLEKFCRAQIQALGQNNSLSGEKQPSITATPSPQQEASVTQFGLFQEMADYTHSADEYESESEEKFSRQRSYSTGDL